MKQRFSSLDVKVIAHELSKALVTLRVSNIYDLSSKIFLIKFAKPENKQQIVIDSGFRCHLTEFSRATAAAPSVFVARLRKCLKTRRVTSVSQVGTDRIIEFQFSDGQYRLFLEFYAAGNIILTDKDLKILALLRIVSEEKGEEEQRVGLTYSLENRQNYGGIPPLTKERLRNALQKVVDRGDDGLVAGKKPKKKAADALRKALAVSITEFPPMLVDHAMRVTEFDSALKPIDVLQSETLVDHLLRSLQEAQRVIQEITSSDVAKGYIIAKKRDGYDEASKTDDSRKFLVYDDFHPFRPRQFESDPASVFLEFDGFNKTVDEFFSSIEGQKLESRLQERELTAKRKIEAARQDQANRLGGLQEVQTLNERKAAALQANVERAQEAIGAINGLIAQAMDWVRIGRLIEMEQKRNNPVASIIKLPLKLEENTITLLLDEEEFGEDNESAYETDSDSSDSEDEGAKKDSKQKAPDKRLTIDVDLAISPWANARRYYDERRSAVDKEQKTLQSSTKALKSQEAKIAHDLKKGLKTEKAVLRPVRKQMWFEKFSWFISSDGYLVLAGKDAQQNETLYKKYLKKGDVYVHADIHGAASVIIRNNPKTPDSPIPPSTLSQAGSLAVACSSAWDSKAGMSAWWVNADQVSKSAPTGEFLPTGSFMVRGKKNFLPPAVLLLGFGVIFQISDESKARHVKHRIQDDDSAIGDPVEQSAAGSLAGKGPEVPEIDEDQRSMPDDHEESDSEDGEEGEEEETVANPLQTQLQPEHVDSDQEPHPITEQIAQLQVAEKASVPSREPEVEEDESEPESDDEIPQASGIQTPSQKGAPKKGPPPAKRGKKGKAKKIATKYKDQDEEDRLAAQKLIGAAAGLEKARAEAEAKAAREAELAFQKERRRAQHQRTQKETAEHEELRRLMLEEGQDVLDEGEEEKMTTFEALVGMPLKGDEILEAIPICAPWAAMARFKYKAKLQPGAQKKGKAVKEILGRWVADTGAKGKVDETSTDTERMWPREVELLKGWKVEEITNTVPVGKVRVMMAGGSAGTAAGKGAQNKGKGGSGKGSKKQR
ncbi:putative nuclear export mediator factor Nemf [Hyaloscypha variabilis F]|uniref:Ribosome quality control complex subunit 2 n=1 Tax=Hyaloscypha variabilis (strain UAMH 11265 / GT02V1 / F) TaxID=1149755 RepID=A0A2J6QZS4_HYAVF|nr:putative nuclear export mediator factor Nemf [Hyaloscypha variabilis F]